MDVKEQAERLLGLVNTLAMHAVELPAGERSSFVRRELSEVLDEYIRQHPGDQLPAEFLELSDKMEESVQALIKIMEVSGGQAGRG